MADEGHEATEALIGEVSERVRREYVAAYEEAEDKLADYLRRFEAKDRIHAEAVERGEETAAEYAQWRKGQILVGERWQEMVDTLAEDYRNADRVAASIVNGYVPDAYALNHDYATFQVEKGSSLDTSYTLYDRATVERLLRDQPGLLPVAGIDAAKDKAWNRRHIASAVTQGILQGESLDRVASRIRSVADMDFRAAMRTARTTMTSAQNAGRVDAYRRAEGMGIGVRKQWLATLDQRTRHSHRRLDGEVVGMDEEFSNGLKYPGDPESGRGSEVYNCRCTLVPEIDGVDQSDAPRRSRLGDMSYEEWRAERSPGTAPASPYAHVVAQGRDIIGEWRRRPGEFDFEIEDVMNAQGFDGTPRLVGADEFDEMVKQANGGRGFIAQRSYTGSSKEIADEYRRTLYEGKWYVDCSTGGSQYGQGMYCAADWTGTLSDGIRAEMDHCTQLGKQRGYIELARAGVEVRQPTYSHVTFQGLDPSVQDRMIKERAMKAAGDDWEAVYTMVRFETGVGGVGFGDAMRASEIAGKYDYMSIVSELRNYSERVMTDPGKNADIVTSYVETLTLDPSARVIKYRDLLDLMNEEPLPPRPGDWAIPGDPGAFAAAKGYDAIDAEGHGASGSYVVVLNRTKLVIKRPEEWG